MKLEKNYVIMLLLQNVKHHSKQTHLMRSQHRHIISILIAFK